MAGIRLRSGNTAALLLALLGCLDAAVESEALILLHGIASASDHNQVGYSLRSRIEQINSFTRAGAALL